MNKIKNKQIKNSTKNKNNFQLMLENEYFYSKNLQEAIFEKEVGINLNTLDKIESSLPTLKKAIETFQKSYGTIPVFKTTIKKLEETYKELSEGFKKLKLDHQLDIKTAQSEFDFLKTTPKETKILNSLTETIIIVDWIYNGIRSYNKKLLKLIDPLIKNNYSKYIDNSISQIFRDLLKENSLKEIKEKLVNFFINELKKSRKSKISGVKSDMEEFNKFESKFIDDDKISSLAKNIFDLTVKQIAQAYLGQLKIEQQVEQNIDKAVVRTIGQTTVLPTDKIKISSKNRPKNKSSSQTTPTAAAPTAATRTQTTPTAATPTATPTAATPTAATPTAATPTAAPDENENIQDIQQELGVDPQNPSLRDIYPQIETNKIESDNLDQEIIKNIEIVEEEFKKVPKRTFEVPPNISKEELLRKIKTLQSIQKTFHNKLSEIEAKAKKQAEERDDYEGDYKIPQESYILYITINRLEIIIHYLRWQFCKIIKEENQDIQPPKDPRIPKKFFEEYNEDWAYRFTYEAFKWALEVYEKNKNKKTTQPSNQEKIDNFKRSLSKRQLNIFNKFLPELQNSLSDIEVGSEGYQMYFTPNGRVPTDASVEKNVDNYKKEITDKYSEIESICSKEKIDSDEILDFLDTVIKNNYSIEEIKQEIKQKINEKNPAFTKCSEKLNEIIKILERISKTFQLNVLLETKKQIQTNNLLIERWKKMAGVL